MMTIELCITYCESLTYKFAGLQYGIGCFCDYSFGKYGLAFKSSECNMTCSGNISTICGGYNRNSIYATSYGNL